LLSQKHLELQKNEIQAITTDENDFDPQSPIKCCTNARVDAMESENSRDKSARFDFGRIKCGEVLRIRSTEPFNLVDVDRF
jgi:hypothetical protein